MVCSRIRQRICNSLQICVASHAKDPGDSIHEKRCGKGAEHQILDSRFQSDRIAAGKADQHVKRNRDQLERDKDKDEIDCRDQVHQPDARENGERKKFAET